MDNVNLENEIAALVTARDVHDYCELNIPDELINSSVEAFAEALAYNADTLFEARDMVEEEGDNWQSEFAPSWTIYTGEAERVIYETGMSEILEYVASHWGAVENVGVSSIFSTLVGAVHSDLTGAVIAAFLNADWPEPEHAED